MGRLRAGPRPGGRLDRLHDGRAADRDRRDPGATSCSVGDFAVQVDGDARPQRAGAGAHGATSGPSSAGCGSWPSISVVVLVAASRRRDRARTWRAVRAGALGLIVGRRDRRRRRARRLRPALRASSTRSSSRPGSYLFDPATDRLVQLFPFAVLGRDVDGRRRRDHRRSALVVAFVAGRRAARVTARRSAPDLAAVPEPGS